MGASRPTIDANTLRVSSWKITTYDPLATNFIARKAWRAACDLRHPGR